MKLIDVEQGSSEWLRARIGIPTASQFHRIVTPKALKLASGRDTYLHELVAEHLLGEPLEDATGVWMERGTEMEAEAASWYEFTHDVETKPGGFWLRDDEAVGCSPDRLIGDDGLLEIKVPSAKIQIGYLLGSVADAYRLQVQGQLWVTGRKWCDVLSYNPDLPPALVRVTPDAAIFSALEEHVGTFLAELASAKAMLEAAVLAK